jgi:putative ABC transport system substrate-binding protein
VEVVPFEIRRPGDIAAVYAAIGKVHVDALSVRGDPQVLDQSRAELAAHALKLGLPSIYEWPFFVEAGGLISYGDSIPGFHHRSASYVSRILKGEKAGDLPIEQPSKFNMVVNLKTAKALRIEIPKSVMFRVDRVIE